ncbi:MULTISPECIES: Hsp20 family protein [Robertmurraya]|uniref:Hsp20/alpha crystallin family protein n=1 Tax=Robertmurraya beringensis TaxID=641660 RepID=A0ABV6KXI4_9BACI
MSNNLPDKPNRNNRPEPFGEIAKAMNDFFQERPVKGFLQSIDEFFNLPFATFPVSVKSYDREHHIVAELPGIRKEQISIDVLNNTLTITVKHGEVIIEEDDVHKAYRRKNKMQHMSRTITLPQAINEKKVKASYHDGLLTIIVPKLPGKKIHIIND